MSKLTAENAHNTALEYAKRDLQWNKTFEYILNVIKSTSERGNNWYKSSTTLYKFQLIKEYFEDLGYYVSVLDTKDDSYFTIVTYKISW